MSIAGGKAVYSQDKQGVAQYAALGNSFILSNWVRESGADFNLESSTGQKILGKIRLGTTKVSSIETVKNERLPCGIVDPLYIKEDGNNMMFSCKCGVKVKVNSGKNVGTATTFTKWFGCNIPKRSSCQMRRSLTIFSWTLHRQLVRAMGR